MITEEFRALVLDKLFKNGKIHKRATREDWIIQHELQELYKNILEHTNFLDSYNQSLRERIFYIENLYIS